MAGNRGCDRRDFAYKERALVQEGRGVGEAHEVDTLAGWENIIILALIIEAEPSSSEDLFARDPTGAAGLNWRLEGQASRNVCFGRSLALRNPPRGLGQIRFLEANAPNCHRGLGAFGNLLLLPHVGDVELTQDRICVRWLAGVERMVFTFGVLAVE